MRQIDKQLQRNTTINMITSIRQMGEATRVQGIDFDIYGSRLFIDFLYSHNYSIGNLFEIYVSFYFISPMATQQ